jgi:2-polyprenyl-3-methyl-5-hydroxy-6-metoxy-1,4-benzoquinol methylase
MGQEEPIQTKLGSVETRDLPVVPSFRDPSGCLTSFEGRILRFINSGGVSDFDAFLKSASGTKAIESGRVVRTRILDQEERRRTLAAPALQSLARQYPAEMIVEHERIPFPSYPYEWAPEMLHTAGELTLDLALAMLRDNIGLKDATPYNVLFRGPAPVFIDVLSFERRDPKDPTWLPYAQFVRSFLLPLLVYRHFGIGLDRSLSARRDGLEPEEVYRWAGPLRRMRRPFLSLVSIPTWLASRQNPDDPTIYRKQTLGNPEKARFILESLLKRLRRTLKRLHPADGRSSRWANYTTENNYSPETFSQKERLVDAILAEYSPKRVLDVGCNTGHFSAMCARHGAQVVGIDYDPVVVGATWREARRQNLDILPLVVDLTRPSPGIGWRNQECPSFLTRAAGAFDFVLMLAVLHHMVVTERVPLRDVLALAAQLTTDLVLIEFVGPEDSMFKRLVRGREELHRGLTSEAFEAACKEHFQIVRVHRIENSHRRLYLLRKRPAG